MTTAAKRPIRLVLAAPRGFCAGVVRAIEIVERALERYGAPVYVRHEIVHNRYVVEDLKQQGRRLRRGARRDAGRRRSPVIFSAHGVPKAVPAAGRAAPAVLPRCHLPAGLQGPHGGGAPFRGRLRDRADRPCRPSRGDRHHGPAAGGRHHPDRDRRRMPRPSRRAIPASSPTSPRRRCRSTTPGTSSPFSSGASPRSTGRTRRTSATPPPTARKRSRPIAAEMRSDPGGRRAQHLELAAPGRGRRASGLRALDAGAAGRRHRLAGDRQCRDDRHHRRRLGARGAGQ